MLDFLQAKLVINLLVLVSNVCEQAYDAGERLETVVTAENTGQIGPMRYGTRRRAGS